MFRQRIKHYHQWLRSAIHLITKIGQSSPDSFRIQSPVSSPQASPKVEASDRPKQAQCLRTCRKVQNGNTRVHQGLSDSRGMGVVDRPIRCLPSHPHPPKLKEVPKVLPTGHRCSRSPPFLSDWPQPLRSLQQL